MRIIDLRSDTMTQPTDAMRRAMAEAEVGDDVFCEDPTINRLEEMAAQRLGKEAALYVSSGTMGNLVSQLTHCGRGDEIILGSHAHTFFFEQGGSAAVGSIHPRTVPNQPDGKLALEDIEAAIRGDNVHFPRTRLILLENTHNLCNGSPLGIDYMKAVGEIARRYNLKIHVDGARIFNAAAALGVEPKDLAAEADSVSFCLSKGLAAPVGSVVCGTQDFIDEARRARKILGGLKIIGATTHNLQEARHAQAQGADYISAGPFFDSVLKPFLKPQGFKYLPQISRYINIPYVAIGGIILDNLDMIKRIHKRLFDYSLKVAICTGIFQSRDITVMTRKLKGILQSRKR